MAMLLLIYGEGAIPKRVYISKKSIWDHFKVYGANK